MSTFLKRDAPIILIVVIGFMTVANLFVPRTTIDIFSRFSDVMGKFITILSSVAFGVGTFYGITAEYNMWRRNRTLAQSIISGSFLALIIIMYGVTYYNYPNAIYTAEYKWYTYKLSMWQAQSQYAVMFLYQCGAVYRVLRLRSMETAVLAFCGLSFILRSIPIFVGYIPGIMEVGLWVAGAPVTGGTRAATLTVTIAALVVSARALMGKETTMIEVK